MQALEKGHRFCCRTQLWLGDDFEQWRARAVQVNARLAREQCVNGLAGVFLKMRMVNRELALAAVRQSVIERSATHDGLRHLADLIALRQVGVEVVLAVEGAAPADLGADGEAKGHGHAHGARVQYGQRTGQAQIYRACLCIRCSAKPRARCGKQL